MNFTTSSVSAILFFFVIGIIAALTVQLLQGKLWGRFLRDLNESGAHDELFSKTLAELGYEKNNAVKYALSHKTSVSLIVERVVDENGTERYYIPEERIKKAESLYRADSFTLATFLTGVILLVALFLICKYLLPYIFLILPKVLPKNELL